MFYDVETYLNRSFPQEPTFIDVGGKQRAMDREDDHPVSPMLDLCVLNLSHG